MLCRDCGGRDALWRDCDGREIFCRDCGGLVYVCLDGGGADTDGRERDGAEYERRNSGGLELLPVLSDGLAIARRFDDDPSCCRWIDGLAVTGLRDGCLVARGVPAVSRWRTDGLTVDARCEVSVRRLVAVPVRSRNVTGDRASRSFSLRVAEGLTLPLLRATRFLSLRSMAADPVFASVREPG